MLLVPSLTYITRDHIRDGLGLKLRTHAHKTEKDTKRDKRYKKI